MGTHARASMNAADFRRLALSLPGAEEGSHMGAADFRVGGRIFATLASQNKRYGNLMLSREQQVVFVREMPEVFLPVAGGWGRMGVTHIRLSGTMPRTRVQEELLSPSIITRSPRSRMAAYLSLYWSMQPP